MIFLHCNLDGSLLRRAPPYLQENFDLLLDRFDTSPTPFLRPRKHESEARVLIWRRTRFVRGRLITKILHLSERVTHLHIAVPTKTRFYASRIHVLKMVFHIVRVLFNSRKWKNSFVEKENLSLIVICLRFF